MAKILTDKEMGKIIHDTCNKPEIIDCQDSYMHFLEDLAGLITDHFGGTAGESAYSDTNVLGYTVAFNVNECVPSDGGIFNEFDTDVMWKDGVETEK